MRSLIRLRRAIVSSFQGLRRSDFELSCYQTHDPEPPKRAQPLKPRSPTRSMLSKEKLEDVLVLESWLSQAERLRWWERVDILFRSVSQMLGR